jgi:hypothetical protein
MKKIFVFAKANTNGEVQVLSAKDYLAETSRFAYSLFEDLEKFEKWLLVRFTITEIFVMDEETREQVRSEWEDCCFNEARQHMAKDGWVRKTVDLDD